MTENKRLADNLKVVFNLLSQCTLPPTPVGKANEVHKVVESFRTIITLIESGDLSVTRDEPQEMLSDIIDQLAAEEGGDE